MQFVVNPGGKTHGVADEEVEVLLHERGFRLANDDERDAYFREQGLDENGNPHRDALSAIDAANERRRLGENVRQENPPTEPFATPSSDSALARVREAKRQRLLSTEATLTPTDTLEGANSRLDLEIKRNQRVIDEANKANAEAVETFNLPTDVPSATNQRAWLGSEDPKAPKDQVPTPAHPAETGQTIGEKIAEPPVTTDTSSAKTAPAKATDAPAALDQQAQQPAEPAENK
jgi:hypothetical protein